MNQQQQPSMARRSLQTWPSHGPDAVVNAQQSGWMFTDPARALTGYLICLHARREQPREFLASCNEEVTLLCDV